MENKINHIFSKDLVTIHDYETISDAHVLMEKYDFRHLPVIDREGYLVGMISKSDYLALVRLEVDLKKTLVKELMSFPVKTFSALASVRAVAQTFVVQKLSSGLVMSNNEIVGIITTEDLLCLLAEKDDLEAEIEKMDLSALASEGWISATSLR